MASKAQARALPRGPHGLSRDEVVQSQRFRLLTAMTDAVAEKGFANTVVADVVARSGVSRATFYQLFRDKEDCFQAAYEMNAQLVARFMEMGLEELQNDTRSGPLETLERVLGLYIDTLATAPALARVFLVEVYAAGPEAIAQRRTSLERFVDIVAATHEGHTGFLGTRKSQRFAAEMIVNAVSAAVTNIIGVGDTQELRELQKKLTRLARQLFAAATTEDDDPPPP
ncbi:MAG TPA: TetR/AcrR family transcriptional regulator [Acidimicrobiales bacterium]|nr:TetR/AcrR family transcriptional regulator [Acidimicrobiales bacterium]